jgi:hypothetical protein
MLEQGNTGSAVGYVDELLEQSPNMLRVKQLAIKIKCGFPVYRDGRVTQIPGEDTLEAFQVADKLVNELVDLAKLEASKEGKSHWMHEPFYAARLQHSYLLYKWSKIDSNKSHIKMIESIERQAPDFGASQGVDPSIPALYRWLATQR